MTRFFHSLFVTKSPQSSPLAFVPLKRVLE